MSDTRDRNLEGKSPDELEQEIEETRARISDEMSALGYKLGPQGLRDTAEDALGDAQDTVTSVTEQLRRGVVESSDSIGGRVSAFIKQNPVPATLFGLGLAWLLKQGQESRRYDSDDGRNYGEREDYGGREEYGNRTTESVRRTGGGRVSSARTDDGTIVANKSSASSASSQRGSRNYRRSERTDTSDTTSDEDEAFRSHYESNFSANGAYEDYEPAYRYGFELASEDEFRGKPWRDARSDAKRRWDDERNEPWFRFDQAVEHGYTTAQSRR